MGKKDTGRREYTKEFKAEAEALARLRKEVKALWEANEILKKAAVIFAQTEPR
jgi:transposase-like protein